jgi:hypothetical protein
VAFGCKSDFPGDTILQYAERRVVEFLYIAASLAAEEAVVSRVRGERAEQDIPGMWLLVDNPGGGECLEDTVDRYDIQRCMMCCGPLPKCLGARRFPHA